MRLAAGAGVPVPVAIAVEPEGGRFGSAGTLMAHVEGESVAPRLLRKPEYEAARERLPGQLAEALARVHVLDASEILPEVPGDPTEAPLDEWERRVAAFWTAFEASPGAGPEIVDELDELAAASPASDGRAHFERACIRDSTGRTADAVTFYEAALAAGPGGFS